MCSHFPAPVHIVIQMGALLHAIQAAAVRLQDLGVCHVMKITIAESIPEMGLLMQQTFCFCPNILARDNQMSIMTVSVTSDGAKVFSLILGLEGVVFFC